MRKKHPSTSAATVLSGGIVAALLFMATAQENALAGGDEGGGGMVGTLPNTGNSEIGQAFYLGGPRTKVFPAIVGAGGAGSVQITNLPDNWVWVEFFGDVELVLDESVLRTGEVLMGIEAGFEGNGMTAALQWGQTITGPTLVTPGHSLEMPYLRLHNEGAMLAGLTVHTWHTATGRGTTEFQGGAGFLTVFQDL